MLASVDGEVLGIGKEFNKRTPKNLLPKKLARLWVSDQIIKTFLLIFGLTKKEV